MIPSNLGIIFTGDTQYPPCESGGRVNSYSDPNTGLNSGDEYQYTRTKVTRIFREESAGFGLGVPVKTKWTPDSEKESIR